ncbi:MAG: cation-transporting P-type ATPase [Nitrosospira multiformis]|nr:cation-transporting P-type ATPase [Nitrosospira multiformis]
MARFIDQMQLPSSFATGEIETGPPEPVRVIHAAVEGRARLEVQGLYRCQPVRRKLESALRKHAAIREASANVLTGRVLIIFDPARDLEEIKTWVKQLLPDAGQEIILENPAGDGHSLRSSRRPVSPVISSDSNPVLPQDGKNWHVLPGDTVVAALETSKELGLSQASAERKLGYFGVNSLPETPPRSELSIFLGQFKSLPVALLGISAVLSAATGGLIDAAVILGVVVINAGAGYVAESQSERTINALGHVAKQNAVVIRDAQLREIAAESLVPGDILVLTPGTRVAADSRVLESRNLMVDESMLTGESLPVAKRVNQLDKQNVSLADRVNMAYMGTAVTGGSGLAAVVSTGRYTEIGTIQSLVGETRPPETPMQRQLSILGNQMVLLSLGICGAMFLIGLVRGHGWLQMLKSSISLAVAAVPEGLPTVATTTLALGIRTMSRHKVLVRRLDAVETLGAVQVICLDKTGTLTLNQMSVLSIHCGGRRITVDKDVFYDAGARIDPYQSDELLRLIHAAVLCNEVELNGERGNYVLKGSATESALVHLALAAGVSVDALRQGYPREQVEYRTETRNYMSTTHRVRGGGKLVAVKGNPVEVLEMCRWWLKDGTRLPLTETERAAILMENDGMAAEALRVLGFAYVEPKEADQSSADELIWLGMTGMADPLRQGMKELIALFHQAGIDTVMITGDQSGTAYAIGKELGLSGGSELDILDSTRLEQLDAEILTGLAQKVNIFSRVSPANKLQIVQALQWGGKVAAMTGDGINDGPALKAADIGVAMGGIGTDVARRVADVVLEDDNLGTMIVAVSEGRTIYNNIRKSVHFLTATNLSEIMVMLGSIGAGWGTPLTTIQLLWINLITDIFPGLALAVEPPEPDVLRRPPRDPREPILGPADFKRYGLEALTMTAGSMASYGYARARYGGGQKASTVVFMTLTMAQLLHAYSCRSDHISIFSHETLHPNRYLDMAIGGTAALQAAAMLVPGVRSLLGSTPIGPLDMVVIGAGSALPFFLNEATKDVTFKGKRSQELLSLPPPSQEYG